MSVDDGSDSRTLHLSKNLNYFFMKFAIVQAKEVVVDCQYVL